MFVRKWIVIQCDLNPLESYTQGTVLLSDPVCRTAVGMQSTHTSDAPCFAHSPGRFLKLDFTPQQPEGVRGC